MNRRAFLTGLIASTALAPCAVVIETVLTTAPAIGAEAFFIQWYKDAYVVMNDVFCDQIIYGVSAWRNVETYPFIERVDPSELAAPERIGGLFNH